MILMSTPGSTMERRVRRIFGNANRCTRSPGSSIAPMGPYSPSRTPSHLPMTSVPTGTLAQERNRPLPVSPRSGTLNHSRSGLDGGVLRFAGVVIVVSVVAPGGVALLRVPVWGLLRESGSRGLLLRGEQRRDCHPEGAADSDFLLVRRTHQPPLDPTERADVHPREPAQLDEQNYPVVAEPPEGMDLHQ